MMFYKNTKTASNTKDKIIRIEKDVLLLLFVKYAKLAS